MKKHSLSRVKKLRKRPDFVRFYGESRVFRLGECTVFRVMSEKSFNRLGITLKVRSSSVERNQVKRQVREAFRVASESRTKYDYNIVITGKRNLTHPFPLQLRGKLEEFFGRSLK